MEALSVDIERKVRALVDAGYYSNKSEVIKNVVIIMSLAYKENVPDTRESPVREMVKELKEFSVNVYSGIFDGKKRMRKSFIIVGCNIL